MIRQISALVTISFELVYFVKSLVKLKVVAAIYGIELEQTEQTGLDKYLFKLPAKCINMVLLFFNINGEAAAAKGQTRMRDRTGSCLTNQWISSVAITRFFCAEVDIMYRFRLSNIFLTQNDHRKLARHCPDGPMGESMSHRVYARDVKVLR
jgi:stage V sporulation protein SpoVS